VKTSVEGSSISAKYVPAEIGEHVIHISFNRKPIDGSPFRAAVYNSKAIKVARVPNGVVGRPVEIDSKFSTTLYSNEYKSYYFVN